MKRKIIQVSVTGVRSTNATQSDYITVALCDDGTVWERFDDRSFWRSVPDVPQDDAPTTTKRGDGEKS